MGTISTGVGLLSGIDTASLIETLLSVEARGKVPIQARLAQLSTAKSALLDVNARLLSLKTASSAFRLDRIFESVLVSSSNPDVLNATATGNPRPGSYSLLVKQLATSSQYLSHGFASRDSSPLGLDSVSFELGNGRLRGDVDLSELNGGEGVQRGRFLITDRSGAQAEVDLSEATTLQEVIDGINTTAGVSVEASINGDGLMLTDLSGGSGQFVVEDMVGGSTAEDLGLTRTTFNDSITGVRLNTLGESTSLSSLNDGRGVLIRDGVTDFVVSVGGVDYDIDLGRVDSPITGTTLLSKLNDGDGISINDDPEEADFEIVTSTGQVIEIDLGRVLDEDGIPTQDEVETVQDLLDRVNGALADEFGAGQVTMTLNADSNGFVFTDNLGGASELEIRGTGPGSDATAEDLGVLGVATGGVLNGTVLRNEVQTARAETIGDLISRMEEATGNQIDVAFNTDSDGLAIDGLGQLVELKSGAPGFSGDAADIPDRTLSDLGLVSGSVGGKISGNRVLSGMGTVLVSGLNGGTGLGAADEMTVTTRTGASLTITGLSDFETLDELLAEANQQLFDAGVRVTLSLNAMGTGVKAAEESIGPTGAGSFSLSGDVAVALGIDQTVDGDSIEGSNLELQYVNQSTLLSELNYGRGIGSGSFRITDATGASATVNIDSDEQSLYDVMKLINTRGLEVRAEINANGDGLTLVDTTSETGAIAVAAMQIEDVSGAVASGLRIAGEASGVGENLEGSYAVNLDLDTSDTIDDLIEKLDDADIPISATVLNTGSGARPWYLSFTSMISGAPGDLVIDTNGVDIGLDELVQGRNAKAFIGSSDPTQALLISSSSNEVNGVIDGVQFDLLQVSDTPITVNITSDDERVIESVRAFTDAFNEVVGRINEYDSYDSETETRGPLLGDPTVSQVRSALYSTLQRQAQNVDGPYQFLFQVGIEVGSNGALEFDENRFNEAWATDPRGVEALFASFDSQTTSTEEIAPGITIERDETYYASLGFGDLFDQMLFGLTDSTSGTLTRADERFQTLIDSQYDRIERIDERIEAKRERLQREFAAMEAALAQLQGQQGALLSMGSNLGLAGL